MSKTRLEDRHREAISCLQRWIEAHISQFVELPDPAHPASWADTLQPLTELSMLIHGLAFPDRSGEVSPLQSWSWNLGQTVAERLDCFGRKIDWKRLTDACRPHPHILLSLVPYRLLANAIGHRWAFEDDQDTCFQVASQAIAATSLSRHPDFLFLCLHFGNQQSLLALRRQMKATLQGLDRSAQAVAETPLYDLTHQVFYLTDFGRREPKVLGKNLDRTLRYLEDFTLPTLQRGNYDLGAELLLARAYAGVERSHTLCKCRLLLIKEVLKRDALTLMGQRPELQRFETDYHPTLVGLLALSRSRTALQIGR